MFWSAGIPDIPGHFTHVHIANCIYSRYSFDSTHPAPLRTYFLVPVGPTGWSPGHPVPYSTPKTHQITMLNCREMWTSVLTICRIHHALLKPRNVRNSEILRNHVDSRNLLVPIGEVSTWTQWSLAVSTVQATLMTLWTRALIFQLSWSIVSGGQE